MNIFLNVIQVAIYQLGKCICKYEFVNHRQYYWLVWDKHVQGIQYLDDMSETTLVP